MTYAAKWNEPSNKRTGPSADEWFTALRKEGWKGRLPSDDKPELEDENADFYRAFWELNSSRQIGFGMGAIPYNIITDWLNEEGIIRIEDRVFYRRIITTIDRAYLEALGSGFTGQKGKHGTGKRTSTIHRLPESGSGR